MNKLPFKAHTQFDHIPEGSANLSTGAPAPDLLPDELLAASAQLALSRDDKSWAGEYAEEVKPWSALQYGPIKGDSAIREALAAVLGRLNRLHPTILLSSLDPTVPPDNLFVTPGSSATLQWILLALTCPQEGTVRAFMPKATYHLSFASFRDVGFRFPAQAITDQPANVEGLPEDRDGIDVEFLAKRLESIDSGLPVKRVGSEDDRKRFRYVLYLVPTHANPTGTVLSADRRRRLVKLAAKHDILVICDDVYEYLSYGSENERLPRLVAFDREYGKGRNVLSNGSFSKILGPGLRCGWLEGHPDLLHQVSLTGPLASGGSPSHLTSRLILPLLLPSSRPHLSQFLETGPLLPACTETLLEDHLHRMKSAYRSRLAALLVAVESHLTPLEVSMPFGPPSGGYFVWLSLPHGISEIALKTACAELKVAVGMGGTFLVEPAAGEERVTARLCWAYNDEGQLDEAVRRLAEVVRSLQ